MIVVYCEVDDLLRRAIKGHAGDDRIAYDQLKSSAVIAVVVAVTRLADAHPIATGHPTCAVLFLASKEKITLLLLHLFLSAVAG